MRARVRRTCVNEFLRETKAEMILGIVSNGSAFLFRHYTAVKIAHCHAQRFLKDFA